MDAREMDSEDRDLEPKVNPLRDSVRAAAWQLAVTIILVVGAHFASKLVSDLMFTMH